MHMTSSHRKQVGAPLQARPSWRHVCFRLVCTKPTNSCTSTLHTSNVARPCGRPSGLSNSKAPSQPTVARAHCTPQMWRGPVGALLGSPTARHQANAWTTNITCRRGPLSATLGSLPAELHACRDHLSWLHLWPGLISLIILPPERRHGQCLDLPKGRVTRWFASTCAD